MRWYRTLVAAALGAGLFALVGCGDGSKYVPVSGTVKVNGKPYANAAVFFQPVGDKNNPNPGRGSSGVTDANGRFTLKTSEGVSGAVVGTHQIKILTNSADVVGFDPATGSKDDVPGPKKDVDPIPADWRSLGNHTFDVPPGGTDAANFDIESAAGKN
ncbi:MAG: DUF4198 domain-containing protein [Gemmataceae bacterium]|nr:DUF4198 domain-containing protein [Gemmataceae bacterium]